MEGRIRSLFFKNTDLTPEFRSDELLREERIFLL